MSHYNFQELPGAYAGLHPVAAATTISDGALVAINAAGNAADADDAITGFVAGRAEGGVDNSAGAAGDLNVLVRRGTYALQLDATNPPTKAHVGRPVYAITPDTVAYTGTCYAGILCGFDAAGRAIVEVNGARKSAGVTLTSTNGTAAAASANLAGLAAEAEKIGDDVRAIHAALVLHGLIV